MNKNSAKCNNHKDRDKSVPSCHVCQRLTIEKRIVTRTIDLLLKKGYLLAVDHVDATPTATRKKILTEVMEVDDEHLFVYNERNAYLGFIYFVYGNDGWDVISDYGMGLDEDLEPINKYCESLS